MDDIISAARLREIADGIDNQNHAAEEIGRRIKKALPPVEEGVPSGTGWLPIESAPKDGTRVLVFVPPYGPTTAHNTFHNFGGDNAESWHLHSCLNKEAVPTHWMPLPPAPGEAPLPASTDKARIAELERELRACEARYNHVNETWKRDVRQGLPDMYWNSACPESPTTPQEAADELADYDGDGTYLLEMSSAWSGPDFFYVVEATKDEDGNGYSSKLTEYPNKAEAERALLETEGK